MLIHLTECRENMLRSQPKVKVGSRKLFKCIRLTIALRYNLGNCIQMFLLVSYLEFHFNAKNCNGTKCFEEVFNATPRTNSASNDSFRGVPQHEGELLHKMVENLWVTVSFQIMRGSQHPHW